MACVNYIIIFVLFFYLYSVQYCHITKPTRACQCSALEGSAIVQQALASTNAILQQPSTSTNAIVQQSSTSADASIIPSVAPYI